MRGIKSCDSPPTRAKSTYTVTLWSSFNSTDYTEIDIVVLQGNQTSQRIREILLYSEGEIILLAVYYKNR